MLKEKLLEDTCSAELENTVSDIIDKCNDVLMLKRVLISWFRTWRNVWAWWKTWLIWWNCRERNCWQLRKLWKEPKITWRREPNTCRRENSTTKRVKRYFEIDSENVLHNVHPITNSRGHSDSHCHHKGLIKLLVSLFIKKRIHYQHILVLPIFILALTT